MGGTEGDGEQVARIVSWKEGMERSCLYCLLIDEQNIVSSLGKEKRSRQSEQHVPMY